MTVNPIRTAYLHAADAAVTLLGDDSVAVAWDQPSALPEFQVRGLAGHLAGQILQVPPTLAEPVPTVEPIGVLDHYARGSWIDAGLDEPVNVNIRDAGERIATAGPVALAAASAATADRLRVILPAEPPGRVVHLARGPWSLRLDDYLLTRMMEIVVHSDDLAVSLGVAAPALPVEVLDPVLGLLSRLAVRRHGPTAVLRAFSRAERAPRTITAF